MATYGLQGSEDLTQIASAVTPRIIGEYADFIFSYSFTEEISKDLVDCATTLRKAIEKLGTEPSEARELSKKIDGIEQRVDEKYLETKSLLIKYTDKMDCATLMLLKDLLESMENVADTCDDTADYVKILTVARETA